MKKVIIVLILIAVIGAVFIGRYDNMFNTVAEIFNKYSVEAVIDGEIVTRNFLIKHATPLDIVRSYNIINSDGEDAFSQKLVEKYQAEIENAEKIRAVTRVPMLNQLDEPLRTDIYHDGIKNQLLDIFEKPDRYIITDTYETDITNDFLNRTLDAYNTGDWASIFAYIRQLGFYSISAK